MKLRFTLLSALAAFATLTSCDKKEEVVPEPVKVDKTAIFEIFAHKDYTSSYYAEQEATIHLRIFRGEKGAAGEPIVFDTTIMKQLKDLPLEKDKLVIRKVIPAVDSKKEWVSLGSGYRVGYQAYGSYESVSDEENMPVSEIVL